MPRRRTCKQDRRAHHYVIDAQNVGVCKKCGVKKNFTMPDSDWAGWRTTT